MISVTSSSLAASENGPMTPANTGRSEISPTAFLIASTYSPERAAPTFGTSSDLASSSSCTTAPMTVGTSSSETRIVEPKHSASTDRSIKLTEAAESIRPATSFMPRACASLSEISSRTLMPMSCTAGKDSTGIARLTLERSCESSHALIFCLSAISEKYRGRFMPSPCRIQRQRQPRSPRRACSSRRRSGRRTPELPARRRS